jgi:DNA-3-methyladenine glycosylase I
MFYFYIFHCKDGTLYCGSTKNLEHREQLHNSGRGAKYTRSRGGGKIVYSEAFTTQHEALRREVEVKKWTRKQKLTLIDTPMTKELTRCPWPTLNDPLYLSYHDFEWGVPLHEDQKIFEYLVLEVFQAGLSWRTVLHKRENFRKAFSNFDIKKVAKFTDRNIARLLNDTGIIRNRLKIESAINNARKVLEIQKEFGSFAKYMWSWVKYKPIANNIQKLSDYKAFTPEAALWSKDLKKRGFKFLGPTVLYAHMQATGMVNDHMVTCFRYKTVGKLKLK